jgi:hypothetical protein
MSRVRSQVSTITIKTKEYQPVYFFNSLQIPDYHQGLVVGGAVAVALCGKKVGERERGTRVVIAIKFFILDKSD